MLRVNKSSLCMRIGSHSLFISWNKLRPAYGIISTHKDFKNEHWQFFDIDDKGLYPSMLYWIQKTYGRKAQISTYPTNHGFHIIVWVTRNFAETIKNMMKCPYIDNNWVSIGVKRGYFFLETPVKVKHESLQYMRIERND